ncbi:MAG: ABC transporter substrate-binding protein [Lautropia sp.]
MNLAARLHATTLSIALSASVLASISAPVHAADPIRIGVPLPVTGAASRWGAFSFRGAELAAKEINDAGGVLGSRLVLARSDDQCVPAEGVSAIQRLLSVERVAVIFGPMCSSVAKAAQPVVEQAAVPMLLAATSDPEITYKAGVGGFRWTFRNYPTDEVRTLIVLENAYQRGVRKFALVAVDNDFGRSVHEFHRKYLPRLPGAELTSVDFFSLKEADFRPILSKVKAAGAQVVLLYATAGDTIQVLGRQMRELGLAGKVRVMGLGDLTHPDNIKSLADVLEGAVESTLWIPQWDNPRSRRFVADYQKAYNGESPNFLAYSYWETMHLLAQAIREAGGTKAEALRESLRTIRYQSAMGPVRFDDHNQANLPMLLLEVSAAKVVPLGTFFSQPAYAK